MMKKITRKVTLKGFRPIMFDRYSGDNAEALAPEKKMYLDKNGGLIIPSANIMSFLCAINTDSAAKRIYPPKEYKKKAAAILSFVMVDPLEIPLLRSGKQIKWEGWDKSGIWLHETVARLAKGIPNPKSRPVIDDPWEIAFTLVMWENKEIKEDAIKKLFTEGGISIGLGTYRGVFGKFEVDAWK